MAITDRTRKLLWGRSGNRCAFCKRVLVIDSTNVDDESIVGEECHIVSPQLNGPRHVEKGENFDYDDYSNLILLCRVHHKMIDDQVNEYTEKKLVDYKKEHERWVNEKLDANKIKPIRIRRRNGQGNNFLMRVTSGRHLFNIVKDTCAFGFDNDDPENKTELELISELMQLGSDLGEMGDLLEPAQIMRTSFDLTNLIKQLEEAGFWVFGKRENQIIEGGVLEPSNWPVAFVSVLRNTNSEIVSINLDKSE